MQERLFRLAPEVIHTQAVYVIGEGWRFVVTMRRQGEDWADAVRVEYSRLSTSELMDVVCEELANQLGIA